MSAHLTITYADRLDGDIHAEIELNGTLIAMLSYNRTNKAYEVEFTEESMLAPVELEKLQAALVEAKNGLPLSLYTDQHDEGQ